MAVPGDPAAARDPARQRLTVDSTGPAGRDDVERELRRLTDRLVSLGDRVGRTGSDGVTPAGRVRPLLQELADLAADAEGRERRAVPALGNRALGDQLAVLARDAVDARADAADVHARLVALRRCL